MQTLFSREVVKKLQAAVNLTKQAKRCSIAYVEIERLRVSTAFRSNSLRILS